MRNLGHIDFYGVAHDAKPDQRSRLQSLLDFPITAIGATLRSV